MADSVHCGCDLLGTHSSWKLGKWRKSGSALDADGCMVRCCRLTSFGEIDAPSYDYVQLDARFLATSILPRARIDFAQREVPVRVGERQTVTFLEAKGLTIWK